MQPFASKIVLDQETAHPLCPRCEAPLARIGWHRIRGGPFALHYVVVLSCGACHAVLDILEGGGGNGTAGIV